MLSRFFIVTGTALFTVIILIVGYYHYVKPALDRLILTLGA